MKVKRFLLTQPYNFTIIGFLVGTPQVNALTGERALAMSIRLGNKEKPADITPFLNQVKIIG
ncbi:hypothetical protein [Bacillus infantis]|uniref:hypothetical protein n=1 Tax=Bacillus infantis TaxID=324767 RepID=UPI00209E4ECC|nr:hypothetical protein [Bacillus infantis]MCP1161356.1 hypothetical protein [Bacillus infantis]